MIGVRGRSSTRARRTSRARERTPHGRSGQLQSSRKTETDQANKVPSRALSNSETFRSTIRSISASSPLDLPEVAAAEPLGVEAGLAGNWSAKIEYLFVDLSSSTFALTGTNNGLSANLFRMGVNYHF